MQDTLVIVAAGGSSSRMGGINKLFADLGGLPVLARSLMIFENCPSVKEVIAAAPEQEVETVWAIIRQAGIKKVSQVCAGGNARQESVFRALRQASLKDISLIAVHDGARPLAAPEDVERACRDARIFRAAVLAVPVKDTIKVVRDDLVVDTPPRSSLYAVQTPQVFQKSVYLEGMEFAEEHGLDFTDDCQLAEAVGIKAAISPGSGRNLKITTPEDLTVVRALWSQQAQEEKGGAE